jgi:hypothetical protein
MSTNSATVVSTRGGSGVGADILGRAVTVGTVLGFGAQGFGASVRITAALSILAVILTVVWGKYLAETNFVRNSRALNRITAPWVIALALCTMLVGVFLRQYHVDKFSPDIGEVAEGFNFRIFWCRHNRTCLAKAVTRLSSEYVKRSNLLFDDFTSDVELGSIIHTSNKATDFLHDLYGIDDTFLGTAVSIPAGNHDYWSTRLPEYLIPNYPASHQGILIWRLEPQVVEQDRILDDVIRNQEPWKGGGTAHDLAALRQTMLGRLGLNEPLPAVVRFAQLSDSDYHGCLGLPERREVFASHLGFIANQKLNIREGSTLSGYSLKEDWGDKKLYVFVFIPAHPKEINAPTWRYVTHHAEAALANPSPCKASQQPSTAQVRNTLGPPS